jgi:hypothetical protein
MTLKGRSRKFSIHYINLDRLLNDKKFPLSYKPANCMKELKMQANAEICDNFEIIKFDDDVEFID